MQQKLIKIFKKEKGNRNTHMDNYLKCKDLNAATKRHRLAEWIQKQDPYTCCLQETHSKPKDTYRLKVRRSEEHTSELQSR